MIDRQSLWSGAERRGLARLTVGPHAAPHPSRLAAARLTVGPQAAPHPSRLAAARTVAARLRASLFAVAWLVSLGLPAACGGSQPKQAGEENNFDQTPGGTPSDPGEGSTPAAPSEGGGALSEDQKKQMEIALRRGGDKASQCGSVVTDAKIGKGDVEVTFDGQKGRIVDVSVGAPWSGTPAEACIKRSFIGEIIMPFEGEPKAVPYTIELVDKKAGASDAKTPDKKAGASDPKTAPKK
jgi:hypothetical protein